MRTEFLNDGNPLPTGHPHAGEIGVLIDFEDGRPATQRVYAADKDALLAKAFSMYGNSQARLTEVKSITRTPPPARTPPPPDPAERVERQMQLTADLADPNKAGKAIVEFIRQETGTDPAADAELARRKAATQQFVDNNPEFVPGPAGALVRDRCVAKFGDITVEGLQQSYDSLKAEGLIDSRQMEQTPPATPPGSEPSAQQPAAPRGTATSYRPSTIGNGGRPPAAPKLTYEEVLRISETPEYERRIREEPGFQQKVNEACEEFEKRSTRRAG
jgi:hypothetical protein